MLLLCTGALACWVHRVTPVVQHHLAQKQAASGLELNRMHMNDLPSSHDVMSSEHLLQRHAVARDREITTEEEDKWQAAVPPL